MDALIGERVIDVQCGDSHTCVLCESGRVYGWGQGMARNAEMVQSLKETFSEKEGGADRRQGDNLEVICFLPRLLSNVEIAHRFLLKEKHGSERRRRAQAAGQEATVSAFNKAPADQTTKGAGGKKHTRPFSSKASFGKLPGSGRGTEADHSQPQNAPRKRKPERPEMN